MCADHTCVDAQGDRGKHQKTGAGITITGGGPSLNTDAENQTWVRGMSNKYS